MGDQRDKPFTPPVPRDHDDLTFSEMVPFRSSKINLFKSPLFILIVLSAVVAPFLFMRMGPVLAGQSPQARLDALQTFGMVSVFFFVVLFQILAYMYVKSQRAIWVYFIPFAIIAIILYYPILTTPFFFVFRQIPFGTMNPEFSMNFMTQFIRSLIGAGMMEELLKATPILFGAFLSLRAFKNPQSAQSGLYKAMHVRGPLDGALMGIFAGGGFIFIETGMQYIPNEVVRVANLTNDLALGTTSALLLLLPRVFGGIVGHMAYSGIFGYFIGLAVIRPKQRWKLLAIGYFTAAIIHASWNSVSVISPLLMYVVAIVAAVGLGAVILKARQLESGQRGTGDLETMGSIVVDRRGTPPQMPAAPALAPAMAAPAAQVTPPPGGAFAPSPPPIAVVPAAAPAAAPPAAPVAGAAVAQVIALDVDGMMMPLRAGGVVDLAAEPALGGRGAGVKGSIISHPTRANVLGLRNDGTAAWSAVLRDGSTQMIAHDQSIRLAEGVRIQFADGLSGAVVKIG